MKLYTQTNKIISLPVSRNLSSKNSFLQKQKLAFTNINTKANEDYYNIKTPRIRSPNLSNKKEKTLGTINSFRLYSKSRSKEKYIKEIENKCPGGTKCINFEKYLRIKEKFQKLIFDNNNTNEVNNYIPYLLQQKDNLYLKLQEENKYLKEKIKQLEKKERYFKTRILDKKNFKFLSPSPSHSKIEKILLSKKDKENNNSTINITNINTNNTNTIINNNNTIVNSIYNTNNNNTNEIDVSSVLLTIEKIKRNKKNKEKNKPRTKSLIFHENNFKLTLTPKKEEKKSKNLDINELKYYFHSNKDSAINQYNKILSLNNKRIFKNSTIKVSFLVTPENILKKIAFNPNLEILYNISQDFETFIDNISNLPEGKLFEICNTIITTIKDFQELIKLMIRIQEFLKVSEEIIESILEDDFCSVLINKLCLILKCDRASVFIYDRFTDNLILYDAEGLKKNSIKIPKNKGIVGSVFLTGEKVKIDDVYLDKRFNKEVDKKTNYRTKNMICFPLIDNDKQIFGAIQAINKINGSFDSDDLEFMDIFCKEASCILKSKLNFGETNNIISKMKIMVDYSNEILFINNLKDLTKKTEDLFSTLFYVSISKLYFYDYDKNDLINLQIGKEDMRIKLLGILKIVFNKREIHVCSNIKNCKYYNDLVDLYSDDSLITFPILCEGEVICIIQTLFPGKISEKTESLKENEMIIIQQFCKILSNFIWFYTNGKPKDILKIKK